MAPACASFYRTADSLRYMGQLGRPIHGPMRMTKPFVAIFATIACCCIAPNASGQDVPVIEVAGAYETVMIRHEFDWKPYQGWAVEASTYVRTQLAITGAIDGSYWGKSFGQVSESHNHYGFLAGITATPNPARRAVPFMRVLAGVDTTKTTLRGFGDLVISGSAFALQLGGGVGLRLTRALSIRPTLEARFVNPRYTFAWHYPQWRFGFGIAYRAASR